MAHLLPSGDTRLRLMRGWVTRTFTGRALLCGAILKLAAVLLTVVVGTAPAFEVIDTVGDVALMVSAALLAYRLLVDARRRMLWRVRRKLTLSYIFIGFVPALLIITFFLLSGLLLFFNVGSYMLRTRLASLVDETQFLAQSAALDMARAGSADDRADTIDRRQDGAAGRYPLASYALARADKDCGIRPARRIAAQALAAGPWAHLPAPTAVPDWVPCAGYAGLIIHTDGDRTRVAARAIAWTDLAPLAVIVDVPLSDALVNELRDDTGVSLREITARDAEDASARNGAATPESAEQPASRAREVTLVGPSPAAEATLRAAEPLTWVAFLEYTDWQTGQAGTLSVEFGMGLGAVYTHIAGSPVVPIGNVNFGQMVVLLLAVIGGLFLVIQLIAFVMGLALARSITGSVHELFAGTERVRRGDFTHKITVRSRDQLGELAESFNSMTASIEDLLQQKAEKERMEQELRIARNIQMSLLPTGPMTFPGLTLTAHCEPAREVGGDYYDFLPIDDHTLGLLVADVSGKGTSAALYMAALKGIVLGLSQLHTSPRQLLIDANRILARHLDSRSFVTVTYLLIDLHSKTLRYARGGHCPMIYSAGPHSASRKSQVLTPDGLVLGLKLADTQLFTRLLDEVTLPLASGDLFMLYTDGLSEAMNPEGDCFGDARLADLVSDHCDLPSDELRERILREVRAFAGTAGQHDDMTMVLVRVD